MHFDIRKRPRLGLHVLIVLASVYTVALLNQRFFTNLLATYPPAEGGLAFVFSVAGLLLALTIGLFSLVAWRVSVRTVFAVLLPVAALCAYFMDTYNVVIDAGMLRNALETNWSESRELLSPGLLIYVILLGVIPAVILARLDIREVPRGKAALRRAALLLLPWIAAVLLVLPFSDRYASFVREHKQLRKYANPIYPVYALTKLAGRKTSNDTALMPVGEDATVPTWDQDRELIVLVVGETARFDRFSLNGYERMTNPRLAQERVFSFSDFWSCGTSTSISVPCMFSLHAGDFDVDRDRAFENALDVLDRSGVSIVWRDNNSDSKGVATRIDYEDFSTPDVNPLCDVECRDAGMLHGLQQRVDAHAEGDMLVVLHQMGNHGPAYFQRYPASFEKFTPVCRSVELNECSREEINNAYDNAILYTDYFLGEVIDFLKHNDAKFETALMYVSDHGESLGEHGLYLHGMPYEFAPDAQKHVPALFWFGAQYHDVDLQALAARQGRRYSHANIFHTLLGLMELETDVYDPKMDMLPHYAHAAETGGER